MELHALAVQILPAGDKAVGAQTGIGADFSLGLHGLDGALGTTAKASRITSREACERAVEIPCCMRPDGVQGESGFVPGLALVRQIGMSGCSRLRDLIQGARVALDGRSQADVTGIWRFGRRIGAPGVPPLCWPWHTGWRVGFEAGKDRAAGRLWLVSAQLFAAR